MGILSLLLAYVLCGLEPPPMCNQWNKPKQGVRTSVTCKCGIYTVRKDRDGCYVPLKVKGRTLQNIGHKTFEEAAEACL